jgi:hypothetical protein
MNMGTDIRFDQMHGAESDLNLNQVSYNLGCHLLSEINEHPEEDDVCFSQQMQATKKFTEDDIGLRIDSYQRRSFAQNYLF